MSGKHAVAVVGLVSTLQLLLGAPAALAAPNSCTLDGGRDVGDIERCLYTGLPPSGSISISVTIGTIDAAWQCGTTPILFTVSAGASASAARARGAVERCSVTVVVRAGPAMYTVTAS